MTRAYVALGANLGDREAAIGSALNATIDLGTVTRFSSVYETDPVGYEDQPRYLNAVAELETELSADALLDALLKIEAEHGRIRTFANAPRTLDLDLLLYGDERRVSPRLTLPHPRMHERAFVLIPLVEIAPDVEVPGHGRAAELLAQLGGVKGVNRVLPPPDRSGLR